MTEKLPITALRADMSKPAFSQFYILSIIDGLSGVSEARYFQCIGLVFQFICCICWHSEGQKKELTIMNMNRLYCQLIDERSSERSLTGFWDEWILWLRERVRYFKAKAMMLFKDEWEFRTFTMTVPLLQRLSQPLANFHNMSFLNGISTIPSIWFCRDQTIISL